jgi:NADH:ubiquinone oxidoreductase subunit 6 (subunit J)
MTEQAKKEVKALRRSRITGNLLQVLLGLPGAYLIFMYSGPVMRYQDKDARSMGVQELQPYVVALVGVVFFAAVAHLMALFNENQFRENAWAEKSRYGQLYMHYFWALVVLSAFLMGALPH